MSTTNYPKTGVAYKWIEAESPSKQCEIDAIRYLIQNGAPDNLVKDCHYIPGISNTPRTRISWLLDNLARSASQFWGARSVNKIVAVRLIWIANEHIARKPGNSLVVWQSLIAMALRRYPA